ncbi:MAG: sugar phosphate isomerase/epimerase [Cytophagaceae bacterium]|jgi:sugar phosphate isomerase/epimerase|nr:sugar phosphate isomerase/epimerase [Cytophagaceae bacterium]
MSYNRRDFFKKGMIGAATVAIGTQLPLLSSCAEPSAQNKKTEVNVPLRLSFQEGIIEGESLNAKFDSMEQLGVTGFEPSGSGLVERVTEIQEALKGRNIHVSAICAGFKGFLLSTDKTVVNEFITSYKAIIVAAGALGAAGVVMVPAFNHQQPCRPHTPETREWLVGLLKELGNFALQNGTAVILEPLNRNEAFYLRQIADAASICREVNSKGVTCMGDFWHMTFEETSDYGAFHAGGDYLSFVHIASRKTRSMPGEDGDADNYIAGFKALKELDYKGYVSFECSSSGARRKTVPAAVKLLNKQWEMA